MVGPLVRLLIINIPGRLWPAISWLSGDWKGVVCRCDILSPARNVCVNFTTSHPQQSTVDSTRTGTDFVSQLNTEMKGNFILLHLVSLWNSFAICLRNLFKRIRWGPKPLSQEVLLRYNQLLHVLHSQHFLSPDGCVGWLGAKLLFFFC